MIKKKFSSKILLNSIKVCLFYGTLLTLVIVGYLYTSYSDDLWNKVSKDKKTISDYLIESLEMPLKYENVVEIRKILAPFLKTSLEWVIVFNYDDIPIFTSGNPPDKYLVDRLKTSNQDEDFNISIVIKDDNENFGTILGALKTNSFADEQNKFLYRIFFLSFILLIFNSVILYFTFYAFIKRIIKLSVFISKYPKVHEEASFSLEEKAHDEISEIYKTFKSVYDRNHALLLNLNKKSLLEAAGQQSKQLAHDIRSPLSALNMITSSLDEVSNEKRTLIKNSIQRINDIANDLLKKSKQDFSALSNGLASKPFDRAEILLAPAIDSIISEKRIQFKNLSSIEISFELSNSFSSFSSIDESEIKRVLSNLINNSVEAIGKNLGVIQISLTSDARNAIIKVTDNGPGIPPHILEKLGTESISYGKENTESGSGLGVLHAKKTIESMNGQFTIASTLGKGTEITITLPLAEKPVWFLEEFFLKPNSTVLICDDDSSIIALWKKRLSEYQNISVNYFTSLNGLKEFLENTQPTEFTLLTDYEFSGEKQTGLDFILENQLASKAILVTSHYDEPDIIQKCTENGIKQIPKNICALVPIEMANSKEYFDAIVLDDEDLQVRSWQFAAIQKGKTIKIFSVADEFLSFLPNIDNKTAIFIDSILGHNIKGEDIAKQVYDLGFKNVYMSSGHDPSYFKDMTFLKGVIGKTPFFP